MSTQIQLHVRTEEMHDDMLRSEGIVDGAINSIVSQLNSRKDYMEEFHDLLGEADSVIVGSSKEGWTSEITDLIDGPTKVDDTLVRQVEALVETQDGANMKILGWVEDHHGEEIFSIHW